MPLHLELEQRKVAALDGLSSVANQCGPRVLRRFTQEGNMGISEYDFHLRIGQMYAPTPGIFLALILLAFALPRGFAQDSITYDGHGHACFVNPILVNSCGPWLGAWANNYTAAPVVPPDGGEGLKSQILYHESRIGRQLSIVHSYHPPAETAISADEGYFIDRPGTYLLINWRPTDPWINAAGGDNTGNAQIDAMATSIKKVAPHKVFLVIQAEPERSVSANNPGLTCALRPGATSGSEADYVAMWHNVRARFDRLHVRNVVWVMDYEGYSKFDPCMTNALYPGDRYVDWVAWDPYDPGTGWVAATNYFYNTLVSLTDRKHRYTSKPWMLAEFGVEGKAGQPHAYQYYADAKAALDSNTYPRLHAYVVFDAIGSLYTQVEYGGASKATLVLDPTEQAYYNKFANDRKFIHKYPRGNPPGNDSPFVPSDFGHYE